MRKRFDEYFAKVVLEYCFPERFVNLKIADKPDLRQGCQIGIEVTNCMPKEAVEAFNLWHRAAKQGEQTPPRILERIEQLKDIVHLEGNSLIWEQGSYINDDINNSPIKEFIKAVGGKVERLNSSNANYEEMGSYDLFVNSAIDISTYNQIFAILERTIELNNKPKKFDNIYLLTISQKLIVFNIKENTFAIKYLYSRLNCLADKAIELYKGVKHDQT